MEPTSRHANDGQTQLDAGQWITAGFAQALSLSNDRKNSQMMIIIQTVRISLRFRKMLSMWFPLAKTFSSPHTYFA